MEEAGGDLKRQLLHLRKELEESRRREEDLARQLSERRTEDDTITQRLSSTSEVDLGSRPKPKADRRSWWQKLFCPSRSPGLAEATEASAQDMCWQLLTSMQDVNALQCNIDDLVITGASKGACKTWGSAALIGKSLETLFDGSFAPRGLLEYKSAAARQIGTGGFSMKSIFHDKFENKQGKEFEATMLVATLPSEPRLHRPGKLLVIIDHDEDKKRMEDEKVAEKKRKKDEVSILTRTTANSKPSKHGRKASEPKEDSEVSGLSACFEEMATVMTDIVIYLDGSQKVMRTSNAKDLGKQEELFGWVLSGENFKDFLDPRSVTEFERMVAIASESSLPRSMRASVKQRGGADVTREATLMLMDTGDPARRYMVGIRLEGMDVYASHGEEFNDVPERNDSDKLREAILAHTAQPKTNPQAMSVAESESSSHRPVPSAVTGHTDLRQKHEGFGGGGVWRVMSAFGLGIGDYQIVRTVGAGGQGVVYQVKDQAGCFFALKKVNLPGILWQRDFPTHLRNADREARVLKSLAWASAVIVRVHDCWIQDDFKYACIVMEWLHISLATCLKERKDAIPLKDTCRWLTHMATGLAIIHEAGFMHRDIKPQNVLLTEDLHWCKIADLGLGRAVHEEPLPADRKDNASQVSQGTSVVVKSVLSGYTEFQGTKDYMSPEADTGGQYNTATDIFSLGCVLFELMASGTLSSHMRHNKAGPGVEAEWSTSCAQDDAKAQLEKLSARIKDEEKDTYKDLCLLCYGMLEQTSYRRPSARNILSRMVLRPSIQDLVDHNSEEKLRKFFATLTQP